MTATPTTIRALFPSLKNPPYTDAALQPWIDLGVQMVDPARWGTLTDFGVSLFAAHNAVLAASPGSLTPGGGGAVTDKRVDKVAISYDPSVGLVEGIGSWNLTSFGVQFWTYAQRAGAGGMQVSPSPLGGYGYPSGVMWR